MKSHSCSDTDHHSYNIGKPISPPARQDFHPGTETSTTNSASSSSDNSIQSCIAHDIPVPTQPKANHSCSNPAKPAPHQSNEIQLAYSNATHCSLKIFNPANYNSANINSTSSAQSPLRHILARPSHFSSSFQPQALSSQTPIFPPQSLSRNSPSPQHSIHQTQTKCGYTPERSTHL
ncbi:hypothetical protein HNY73_005031 [Argiope bruennichi]|uniref:Uncharacterized protein n=1 Tax=Argiope bruennichi TaxID=94029 RepID=A0A8T0FHT2_ARGBR|nr:hypothetical protein HNY73_005031 [Argiope bruennichi]